MWGVALRAAPRPCIARPLNQAEQAMLQLKKLGIVLFSTGWIAPMWLAAFLFVDFWQAEGWPHLLGRNPGNSFEWFGPIKGCLGIAFAWLAAVVAYWSWVGARASDVRRSA
jgi:hypothetical protein